MGKKKVRKDESKNWKTLGSKERGAIVAILIVIGLALGYTRFSGELASTPVERGEKLYQTYCESCHGLKGIGERPDDIYAMDEYGFVAPPMDDTGHAWHHTDEALIEMTLEGSQRNPRMVAWKNVLLREDAEDLVEYIKSLWSPHIRENCQGPKHMKPECGGHISE